MDGATNGISVPRWCCRTPSEGKPSMGESIRNFCQRHAGRSGSAGVFPGPRGQPQWRDRCCPQAQARGSSRFRRAAAMRGGDGGDAPRHHWERALIGLGHSSVAAAHVKPYIAPPTKATRLTRRRCRRWSSWQRFVPVRSIENQTALMRHQARRLSPASARRRSILRGHLAEIGVVAPADACALA